MNWDRRNQIFLLGAPLAVIPAVAFLPAFVFVFLRYPIARTQFDSWLIFSWLIFAFPVLVFSQLFGSVLVGFSGFPARLGYVTFLAAATIVFLMVVAAYTGLFFAIFAGPN
jgi:hypothetical protein